jgi:hypothetical protein
MPLRVAKGHHVGQTVVMDSGHSELKSTDGCPLFQSPILERNVDGSGTATSDPNLGSRYSTEVMTELFTILMIHELVTDIVPVMHFRLRSMACASTLVILILLDCELRRCKWISKFVQLVYLVVHYLKPYANWRKYSNDILCFLPCATTERTVFNRWPCNFNFFPNVVQLGLLIIVAPLMMS